MNNLNSYFIVPIGYWQIENFFEFINLFKIYYNLGNIVNFEIIIN